MVAYLPWCHCRAYWIFLWMTTATIICFKDETETIVDAFALLPQSSLVTKTSSCQSIARISSRCHILHHVHTHNIITATERGSSRQQSSTVSSLFASSTSSSSSPSGRDPDSLSMIVEFDDTNHEPTVKVLNSTLDMDRLSSPRGWLEWCEERKKHQPRSNDIKMDDRIELQNLSSPSVLSSSSSIIKDNDDNDQYHPGAYTVIRCDLVVNGRSENNRSTTPLKDQHPTVDILSNHEGEKRMWKIWGWDFHLNRLKESFLVIGLDDNINDAESMATSSRLINTSDNHNEYDFQTAQEHTTKVMDALLQEVTDLLSQHDRTQVVADEKMKGSNIGIGSVEPTVCTVMVTILWEAPITDESHGGVETDIKKARRRIRVSGHGFTTMKATKVFSNGMGNPNSSINAVIAVDNRNSLSLPNRYEYHPEAKISSWCRRRRPLEQLFKLPRMGMYNKHDDHVGEVILTRTINEEDMLVGVDMSPAQKETTLRPTKRQRHPHGGLISLLEGLTSNFFVVDKNNVLRTPPIKEKDESDVAGVGTDSILAGYGRHLVLKHAKRLGYEVEIGPIMLNLNDVGHTRMGTRHWKEVFITSSIRLVVPVRRVLILTSFNDEEREALDVDSPSRKVHTIWEDIDPPLESQHSTRVSDHLYKEIVGERTIDLS